MNDFDYDVMTKKNIARNAKYRKSGSKSRRCTLSHENLSKKELEAMNGPVTTYNLSKPMTWHEYKTLPPDLRAEYLRKLKVRFGPDPKHIAEMFGVTPRTAGLEMGAAGTRLGRGVKMTAGDEVAWNIWLGGGSVVPEIAEDEIVETEVEDTEASESINPEVVAAMDRENLADKWGLTPKQPVMRNGKLFLEGSAGDVTDEIARFLSSHPGNCRVNLKFEFID